MKLWKDFRTNMMYWRFRYITRNRLRLQTWWSTKRRTRRPTIPASPYRERGMASSYRPYRSNAGRLWVLLLVMVALLTALKVIAAQTFILPGIAYAIGAAIVIASGYIALRIG